MINSAKMQLIISRLVYSPATLGLFTRNISSWASAIRRASSPQKALHLYTEMQQSAIPFDSYSILFTLRSCCRLHDLTLTRHLHAHIFKIGFSSHVYVATSLLYCYVITSFQEARKLFDEMPDRSSVTFNTMITGYFKLGDVESARSIFDCMPVKDVASWSAMIAGYMNGGDWHKGLALFRELIVAEGIKPDQATFGAILPKCTNMGSVGLLVGKSIHGFMIKNGWRLDVESGTALVDMYAKCGLLKNAFFMFERMKERNVLTWSAMICGLAQHGYGEKALAMFERMKGEGVRPNEVTFTGIFSACMHRGFVEEGLHIFRTMVDEYGLEPRIQHYGCMVDMLGKAGRLEEAYAVIESMKLEPNIVVLSSFLASCKVHKQFGMAEKVIERALKVMKPETDGGVYTLISNLYALSGKWDEAQRMRYIMANQNVKKARGLSSIRSHAI